MQLETIIGLEIHIQLSTASKMFCSCSNAGEDLPVNTTVCPICLGHPGTLPTINHQAVELGAKLALALGCKIQLVSEFARKNYFYPDLPKGYQISQFDKPLAKNGQVEIVWLSDKQIVSKQVGIERLHLEEDAAKNFHFQDKTLVDYNRGGTPLAEIVTQPDFRSAEEARVFLQELQKVARYLEVSQADMEKGHLRCDANISLRPLGEVRLYPKTEIKNLNSFKAVEKALKYEQIRQTELWQGGQGPKFSSTRGWSEAKGETTEQRDKEESADYRYFPEPDLPPLVLSEDQVEEWQARLGELPQARSKRFMAEYGLGFAESKIVTDDKMVAEFFEQAVSEGREWLTTLESVTGSKEEIWRNNGRKLVKLIYDWLVSEVFKHLNAAGLSLSESKLTPENFAEFVALVYEGKINSSAAQIILQEMFTTGEDPAWIMKDKDLGMVDNLADLADLVVGIIQTNPEQVSQYQSGKTNLIKYFVGLAMKESNGKANPEILTKLFTDHLSSK
ncbi:MAG: Asp-tRNA(Asn)/Glu-tRNA(Gln) amidotransferase subunit GatB [Candidatus Komeilibacteria bacterium]|nr:Asp-tRNA(Asn)/Glu-tRNA(Gln) amidotransferase subunit GatB [Candidatus Komeilibacteria bacterium]